MANRSALAGALVLAAFAALAVGAPRLAPYDPRLPDAAPLSVPTAQHPFGTNDLGQDLYSTWLWGGRISLEIAALVAALSTALAWSVGLLAGVRQRSGGPLLALADLLLALPTLPLYLVVLTLVGPSQTAVIVVLGLLAWPTFARVVRAQVVASRTAPYVEAARALGATSTRIARVHLLPSTTSLLPAHVAQAVRYALFAEATLAFLGLGDRANPSWGGMLGAAFADPLLFSRPMWPWWVLPPAVSIVLVVLASTWLATRAEAAPWSRSTGSARRPPSTAAHRR